MALLSAVEVKEVAFSFADQAGKRGPIGFGHRKDLITFFTEVDAWVNSKQAEFKAALSEPAKSSMTAKQLVEGMRKILDKRYGVS